MQSETAKVSIDDATLVRQCQNGDSTATERLILRYQDRIYNSILRICGNPDDAAELTQDTFVKIIENIDGFQSRSGFYTWAFRIAVNLTLSYCKRSVKLGLKSLDQQADEYGEQAAGRLKNILCDDRSPDPSQVAADKELCGLVTKAILMLDDSQRAVVVLRDIEGMDYGQIAEVLDVELGTVKSRLSRARANLREILESTLR